MDSSPQGVVDGSSSADRGSDDRSPTGDAPADVSTAANCSDLSNQGPTVTATAVMGAPPVARGGAIVGGVYELTAAVTYYDTNVAPPYQLQAAMRIDGSRVDAVGTNVGGTFRNSYALSTSGAMFSLAESCPGTSVSRGSFDASPTAIVLYYVQPGLTISQTFTRR